MKRREFLRLGAVSVLSGAAVVAGCARSVGQSAGSSASADAAQFSLRIAPVKVDLAPKKTVQTIGYNGGAPGPLLRVKEGQRVTVDVKNDSDVPELHRAPECSHEYSPPRTTAFAALPKFR